jgi:ribonuclease-3
MADYSKFEEKTGIKFNDESLLTRAFTHRSYLNENRDSDLKHNERLEFLGDAVMELVTTDYLFKQFPKKNEGELTAYRASLVNTQTISEASTELEFNDHLLLSKGEAKDTGRARQYILANTFESVIGAIYLDQGYDAARQFIEKFLIVKLDKILSDGTWIDAKSKLQEIIQEKMSITPTYKIVKEEGPDHDKKFTVALYYGEAEIATAEGKSKQEAEQEAAREVLKKEGVL